MEEDWRAVEKSRHRATMRGPLSYQQSPLLRALLLLQQPKTDCSERQAAATGPVNATLTATAYSEQHSQTAAKIESFDRLNVRPRGLGSRDCSDNSGSCYRDSGAAKVAAMTRLDGH